MSTKTDDEVLRGYVAASDHGICRRCGRTVFFHVLRNRWQHVDPDGFPSMVGCRSTSFDFGGYDDSLRRSWKAVPA